MAQQTPLRFGVIGFGVTKLYLTALSSVHHYYPDLPPVELVGIATASPESNKQAQDHFGFQWHTEDYRKLLDRRDIDMVMISTPNYLHKMMLMDALQTDKAIYADKPLALNLTEAREILELSERIGRDAQMIFEFRFCPAVQIAAKMIREGRLGRIITCRGFYYRSSYTDPKKSLRWKGVAAQSGGGAIVDLGSHVIDMLSFLVGFPEKLTASFQTIVPERPSGSKDSPVVAVDTEDHAVVQMAMPGGAVGIVEAGRMVTGTVNDMGFEIFGSQGSLRWNMMDPNFLYLADGRMPPEERGWLQVPTVQRYPDAAVPGSDVPLGMMRFHIASLAEFIRRTQEGKPYDPNIRQGLRVQTVVEAALEAAKKDTWVKVAQF